MATVGDVTAADVIYKKLADTRSSTSMSGRTRGRRWEEFVATYPDLESMDVLDLGGRVEFWTSHDVHPNSVTVVNPFADEMDTPAPDWISTVVADAAVEDFDMTGYDLCHANSVIEHVGGPYRRAVFASNVRASADHYWIQTPYRYFPIEPHWLFPGFQFLPLGTRAWLSEHWPLSPWDSPGIPTALDVELLTITEMRHLFPGSELYREKIGGLTKSITAHT